MGGKKIEVDAKAVALCKEYRKKLDDRLPEDHYIGTKEDPWWKCEEGIICYEKCPVATERDKIYPKKEKPKDVGMGFKSDGGKRTIPENIKNPLGINLEVFEELTDDRKKPKKFSREVEDFLWLQGRVLDKLAFHPDLYRLLDRLTYDEIMDKLAGKTGVEGVPKQLGGNTEAEYSPETKKYFADLEKKFAKEEEEKKKKADK